MKEAFQLHSKAREERAKRAQKITRLLLKNNKLPSELGPAPLDKIVINTKK